MDNTICFDELKFKEEKLPPTNIDQIVKILDDKNFGVKGGKALEKIIERIKTDESDKG